MIKAAVFGYGNVGKAVIEAVLAAPDFQLTAIVSSSMAGQTIAGVKVLSPSDELPEIDVAILAQPSRTVSASASALLKKGICTVDSFDIHDKIPEVWEELSEIAKANNSAAVIAAGWDPGTDSIIRALLLAMAPAGITYTNFGPGMSMGHTVAVKAIEGVKDALSMTIPVGTGIHRRMVYVEVEDGYEFDDIAAAIKADKYFVHDETHVKQVPSVKALKDTGHGVHIERKGVSGIANNQLFSFDMKINNPALTAQIMVCSARAVMKQQPGCYTLIEIPMIDFLPMERKDAITALV